MNLFLVINESYQERHLDEAEIFILAIRVEE
jgi:hypothetical protein